MLTLQSLSEDDKKIKLSGRQPTELIDPKIMICNFYVCLRKNKTILFMIVNEQLR
jgi:hypothetical protein